MIKDFTRIYFKNKFEIHCEINQCHAEKNHAQSFSEIGAIIANASWEKVQDTFRRYIFNKAEFAPSSLTGSGVILFIDYIHRNTRGSKCDILFCGNSFGLDNESSPARNLICCNVNKFAGRADWISETITQRRWATRTSFDGTWIECLSATMRGNWPR